MGKVSDYISSLDGKENIDPLVIASTLLELHNAEMETATSKIASLETTIQENGVAVAERDSKITELKAKNWDLVNRVPMSESDGHTQEKPGDDKDASEVTFDDFFEKED